MSFGDFFSFSLGVNVCTYLERFVYLQKCERVMSGYILTLRRHVHCECTLYATAAAAAVAA